MSGDQADDAVAAKKRKRFYVYKLYEHTDIALYVGKGSGRRLKQQMRRLALKGEIVKEFDCERSAFAFERAMIEAARPELNRNIGGSGGWVRFKKPKAPRKTAEEREMDRIGTRAYCARMLLRFDLRGIDPARLSLLREVAYGSPL